MMKSRTKARLNQPKSSSQPERKMKIAVPRQAAIPRAKSLVFADPARRSVVPHPASAATRTNPQRNAKGNDQFTPDMAEFYKMPP